MKCPICTHLQTKVIDSRLNQTGDITRRRRQCERCEGRFTTYERVEVVMPVIIKKDGRRENYDHNKVLQGIQKACQKREIPIAKIDQIVRKLETRIQGFGLKELPARVIGQMVMATLKDLDQVAYIRFASVYREFKDMNEFMAELKEPIEEINDDDSLSFPFIDHSAETSSETEGGTRS